MIFELIGSIRVEKGLIAFAEFSGIERHGDAKESASRRECVLTAHCKNYGQDLFAEECNRINEIHI